MHTTSEQFKEAGRTLREEQLHIFAARQAGEAFAFRLCCDKLCEVAMRLLNEPQSPACANAMRDAIREMAAPPTWGAKLTAGWSFDAEKL